MDKTSLGDRMKTYEAVPKNFLMRRTPCIIRLDGKAFHTFTHGFDKPFDDCLMEAMQETMLYLCKNIQGCVLGYTQSDEITLVLCDYQKLETAAWFDYNVQKMVSVSASMATFAFTKYLSDLSFNMFMKSDPNRSDKWKFIQDKLNRGAFFDSRCFSLPISEVTNCLIWRQQDATRNSIQALAQSLYSHKQIEGLSCNVLQNKMLTEKDVNWNDLDTTKKRGSCAIKVLGDWVIDKNIPIFTQDRSYIESRIIFAEDN